MAINAIAYKGLLEEIKDKATLVAVSKIQPVQAIQALYDLGQRDFGENYVQELVDKAEKLPKDIRWHFIGHLQRNKVKYIAPFVHLIHGVDSFKLLDEINNQAAKCNRVIDCLFQVHIAQEETKFGFNEKEVTDLVKLLLKYKQLNLFKNVDVLGLMGMASFSDDEHEVRYEFKQLKLLFDKLQTINPKLITLSMGMSGDYKWAIEEGSNMVRIGSLLFGARS